VNALLAVASLSDADVVARVRAGDTSWFEILMRRHNQRVYRVARSIVKDEGEAEDVMQQAYINAFMHLDQFEQRAQFSTWLTRIAVHEALARRRKWQPDLVEPTEHEGDRLDRLTADQPDPERQAYTGELSRVLEGAVDSLPEHYRTVFVLRDIEGLSTSEAAAALEVTEEAVKTRLHRARAMVRRAVTARIGAATSQAFHFHASRCDRVVTAVLSLLASRP
jgi:RNA polymerase sigma-70 factor (ECF subfamily)